jgi:Rps23 Pro-64 3,4-dihydroxylase Tpa1-like proline 4-hydroxylase
VITVKNNFLDETFIDDFIKNIIKESQEYKPIWKSNINWGENIVKNSSLVLAYEINKENLNYIKSKFIELNDKFKDKEIVGHFYIWTKGSYIPMHNDSNYEYGCTIYLNKYWNIDWGGLYIWKENDKLNIEKPEFNKLIINKGNTKHGTTLLNYNVPEERLTIQIFFK